MSSSIHEIVQLFNPGNLVELFDIDLTVLGGTVLHWAGTAFENGVISFGGVDYLPMSIEAEGFEWQGSGTLPTPAIRLFPSDGLKAAMLAYDDFIGAKITRIKTFSRFLDGQPDADSSQRFPDEIYYFEQKTVFNKNVVEWRLTSVLDLEGVLLPKRVFLRDICDLKYRRYNAATDSFEYVSVADGGCPFNSNQYYDVNDDNTTKSGDKCSKRLSGCRKRFGTTAVLPFSGFPGL